MQAVLQKKLELLHDHYGVEKEGKAAFADADTCREEWMLLKQQELSRKKIEGLMACARRKVGRFLPLNAATDFSCHGSPHIECRL